MAFRTIVCLFVFCFTLTMGCAFAQGSEKESAAIEAAKAWLALIDEGKYGESWDNAAGYFRNAIPREQWEQSLKAVRKPLGGVLSRKVIYKEYKTSLPGAPNGEYVVIQFESSFKNKKSAVETVTPMLEKDGNWKVAGYYLK